MTTFHPDPAAPDFRGDPRELGRSPAPPSPHPRLPARVRQFAPATAAAMTLGLTFAVLVGPVLLWMTVTACLTTLGVLIADEALPDPDQDSGDDRAYPI